MALEVDKYIFDISTLKSFVTNSVEFLEEMVEIVELFNFVDGYFRYFLNMQRIKIDKGIPVHDSS